MRRYKPGRYVETKIGIGIIFDCKHLESIEIHYTDPNGETTGNMKHPQRDVRVLRLDEIPKTRMAKKTKGVNFTGYKI